MYSLHHKLVTCETGSVGCHLPLLSHPASQPETGPHSPCWEERETSPPYGTCCTLPGPEGPGFLFVCFVLNPRVDNFLKMNLTRIYTDTVLCKFLQLGSDGKESASHVEIEVLSLDWEDPLGKEMATCSNILAWKLPWTEEPGRLHFMESQRVGYDWETNTL